METLRLKNFGPLSDIDITLRKISVFIGEQGVGKSTLAKLLTCLRDLNLQQSIIQGDIKLQKALFREHDLNQMFTPDTEIEYYSDDINITISYKDKAFCLTHPQLDTEQLKKLYWGLIGSSLAHVFRKLGIDINNCTHEEIEKYSRQHRRTLRSNMRLSFYCPADRGLVGTLSNSLATLLINETPLPPTLVEYMSFFEKARQSLSPYKIDFLNLKYTVKDDKESIEFDGKKFSLQQASSGIQSILPMMMVMDYCLKEKYFSSFTIEEPELNLFPSNQRELIRFILSRTYGLDSKVDTWAVTTHSPYILSILNVSLLAGMILRRFPAAKEEVENVMTPAFIIAPEDISVYALNLPDKKSETPQYLNLIDDKTGLISENYLDSVSDLIADEFKSLNKILLNQVQKNH